MSAFRHEAQGSHPDIVYVVCLCICLSLLKKPALHRIAQSGSKTPQVNDFETWSSRMNYNVDVIAYGDLK